MNRFVRSTADVKRLLAWAPGWLAAGMLLFTATGCYTQLAGTYPDYDREPDYVEVEEYEGEYGDSVVVSRYYYDDEYYDDYDGPYQYRRYFSRFYDYPYYSGYYDPFYYDPWHYGSRFHIGFGFGHHGYYSPWYYDPFSYGGYYGGYYGYGYPSYGYGGYYGG